MKETPKEDYEGMQTCRGCSGYGNCGYRKYCIVDGKAKAFCVLSKQEAEARAAEEAAKQAAN